MLANCLRSVVGLCQFAFSKASLAEFQLALERVGQSAARRHRCNEQRVPCIGGARNVDSGQCPEVDLLCQPPCGLLASCRISAWIPQASLLRAQRNWPPGQASEHEQLLSCMFASCRISAWIPLALLGVCEVGSKDLQIYCFRADVLRVFQR